MRGEERGLTSPPVNLKQAPQMIVSEADDAKPISLDTLSLWGMAKRRFR